MTDKCLAGMSDKILNITCNVGLHAGANKCQASGGRAFAVKMESI